MYTHLKKNKWILQGKAKSIGNILFDVIKALFEYRMVSITSHTIIINTHLVVCCHDYKIKKEIFKIKSLFERLSMDSFYTCALKKI